MCYNIRLTKEDKDYERRFRAIFLDRAGYRPGTKVSAFIYPQVPIITNVNLSGIKLYHWGLIPSWAKDDSIRKNTLNARIETITEKPSFRSHIYNRCLVLVDGFHEWQWLDPKGTIKQMYLLTLANDELFALAGLWNTWINPHTGEVTPTFTILTTQANEQMERIHNSKKRMPMILTKDEELAWLKGKDIDFNRSHISLIEQKIV